MSGEFYGFVRFSKVRDVGKLLKVVNAVKVGEGGKNVSVVLRDDEKKQVDEGEKMVRVGEVAVPVREGKAKGGRGCGVKVVGAASKTVEVVREMGKVVEHVVVNQQPVVMKLVRMYRSNGDDLRWAR